MSLTLGWETSPEQAFEKNFFENNFPHEAQLLGKNKELSFCISLSTCMYFLFATGMPKGKNVFIIADLWLFSSM